ncbi:MAG TPA: hypothetical protein VGW38_15980, partial [Chloroflexota bacterium]|nr:hypothetical protein [Chloroflexota bacterium]
MRTPLPLLLMISAAGCTQPGDPAPSLAPRAGETIDPRIPVEGTSGTGVVDPALASRLSELVAQARMGDAAFVNAAAVAERLIAAADARQSESWVAAQQALSAVVAARGPTTRAAGDIDALAAAAIAERSWIPPADQAAIEAAAAQV